MIIQTGYGWRIDLYIGIWGGVPGILVYGVYGHLGSVNTTIVVAFEVFCSPISSGAAVFSIAILYI